MAKKKKVKSQKKVTKKTPLKKAKKKAVKKIAKKASAKPKTATNKKVAVKKEKSQKSVEVVAVAPVKKLRKKRITKAEKLRVMQKEQLVKKWHSLCNKLDDLETAKYNMKNSFEAETAISHPKLGWGFIMSNTNDRLEVLFEDGIKNLISNYKSK